MTNPEHGSTKSSAHRSAAALAASIAVAATAAAAEAEDQFLAGIQSDDEEANYAAWSMADQVDPSVIPALAKLLAAKQPNVRKAAEEALKKIVHSVGKTIDPSSLSANAGRPDNPGQMDRRQQVVTHLLALLEGKRAEIEMVTALRHLSLIATSDDVEQIAALIHNAQLREEVVFCLERIPGKTSEEALLNALPFAADEFRPRILAALGHRRADEAAAACVESMGSPDSVVAMAGMKAWARIGVAAGPEVEFPALDSLDGWQKIEFTDSLLRYADAQVEKGNSGEASKVYREMLEREEEHLQCAAIIGLASIGTAEAAAAIFPKLQHENNTVRITARQAWDRLAGESTSA